jgi:hypothetical protein
MSREPEEPVSIETVVLRETDKAVLVEVEGEQVWIPKSQIDPDSEITCKDDGPGTMLVSRWIAELKGLV